MRHVGNLGQAAESESEPGGPVVHESSDGNRDDDAANPPLHTVNGRCVRGWPGPAITKPEPHTLAWPMIPTLTRRSQTASPRTVTLSPCAGAPVAPSISNPLATRRSLAAWRPVSKT